MSERQAVDLIDKDGNQVVVTVSQEFGLVKIETTRDVIVMPTSEFEAMARWVLNLKAST